MNTKLITLALLASAAPATATIPKYSITRIGVLSYTSAAYGISSTGFVTGSSDDVSIYLRDMSRAFFWDSSIHDYGQGQQSIGVGVNAQGTVAGTYRLPPGTDFRRDIDYRHAFVETRSEFKDLGTLGGTESVARGINDAGWVTGLSYTVQPGGLNGSAHAFFYNGTMHDIGTLGGSDTDYSEGHAINGKGYIVGESSHAHTQVSDGLSAHAFAYAGGVMTDIGARGGGIFSNATGINDNNDIVGYATFGPLGAPYRPFLVHDGGNLINLGTLGGNSAIANGINNAGLVVGESDVLYGGVPGYRAFVYDGRMHDLNDFVDPASGWVLGGASAINDYSQIVGTGTIDGHSEAFLLTPDYGPPAGSTPGNPLLPAATLPGGGIHLDFTVEAGVPVYVDPLVATGYDYTLGAGNPQITAAMFPVLAGDTNGYDVYALSDLATPLFSHVMGGQWIDFTSLTGFYYGIRGFALRGIDLAAGLDPANPTAFVTGLRFGTSGTVAFDQTPVSTAVGGVPEPATWALLLGGFGAVGAAQRRRRETAAA